MADLSLFGSYTHSTYSYPGHILISIGSYTYSRLPKDIYIGTYTDTCLRLKLISISHRSYRTYAYTEVRNQILVFISISYLP